MAVLLLSGSVGSLGNSTPRGSPAKTLFSIHVLFRGTIGFPFLDRKPEGGLSRIDGRNELYTRILQSPLNASIRAVHPIEKLPLSSKLSRTLRQTS